MRRWRRCEPELLRIVDADDALRFEVDTLPDTSYAADLRAGMKSRSADYGIDLLYSIPPADVVPNAVEIIEEPGTGVQIEIVRSGVLQAIAIVSRAPRGNGGHVRAAERHPGDSGDSGKAALVALTLEDLIASIDADLEGPSSDDPVLPTGVRTLAYWQRLLDGAVELVEGYAPAAPTSVKDIAIVRCAGHMHEHTWSSMSQLGDGGKQISFAVSHLSALRHSGAMAILSRFKVRRGAMKLWPFGRTEKRATQGGGGSQGGAGFTDAIVGALLAQAGGGASADASATAALEAAAGQYARAFAVAEVTPDTPATRALRPELLALAARDLIRRGEFVWAIEVGRGRVRLLPCGSWDVRGRWDPVTWRYRVDLFGPSTNATRFLPAASVVHGRYSVDPARPWWGVSPLGWATLTGRLHANIEDAIADEAGGTRGHVLPVPAGPDGDGDDDDDDATGPERGATRRYCVHARQNLDGGNRGRRMGRGCQRGATGRLEAAADRR